MRWRNEEGLKPATINRRFDTLSAALAEAFRAGKVIRQPQVFRFKGIKNTKDRFMSDKEEQDALECLRELYLKERDVNWKIMEALVVFLLDVGARLGEALGARFDDIDDAGIISFHRYDTKTSAPRRVPLSSRVMTYLPILQTFSVDGDHLFNGMSQDQAWRRWKKVRDALPQLQDFNIHLFRHTCGTRLRRAGVPLEDIAEWLGHSDLNTTRKRYAHVLVEDKLPTKAVLDRLNDQRQARSSQQRESVRDRDLITNTGLSAIADVTEIDAECDQTG